MVSDKIQWILSNVDQVVQESDGDRGNLFELVPVHLAVFHHIRQVNRTQQTTLPGTQWLFPAIMGVKAVGVKSIYPGHLNIINILYPIFGNI